MNEPLENSYRKCHICHVTKPLTLEHFYTRSDTGKFYYSCIPCGKERVKKWKTENKEKVKLNNAAYLNNNETNFIRATIGRMFKPSSQNPKQRENQTYKRKGWVPELTKDETYAELMLHIQHMKNKHPESDGRLCRYCEKPWTYIRKERKNKTQRRQDTTHTNFSVDRFDSLQTYKLGNIIFCCNGCNIRKNNSTKQDWLRFLQIDKELKNEN